MPHFCHFWRMTPAEFRALSLADYTAMRDYQAAYAKAMERPDVG